MLQESLPFVMPNRGNTEAEGFCQPLLASTPVYPSDAFIKVLILSLLSDEKVGQILFQPPSSFLLNLQGHRGEVRSLSVKKGKQ